VAVGRTNPRGPIDVRRVRNPQSVELGRLFEVANPEPPEWDDLVEF
jgi:hypothetical protein